MIIAQISDTHIALDTPDADRGLRDFEVTIADINALDPAPDVIVHTGDIVHNGREDEYAAAIAALAAARAPVYVIAGNKDDRANLHAAFARGGYLAPDSGFIDYAIEDYPVRLIAIDTSAQEATRATLTPCALHASTDMIDAESHEADRGFRAPPAVRGNGRTGADQFRNRRSDGEAPPGAAALRTASSAVFSGHVHRGTSGHVGNIPATVMPSIATTMRYGTYPAEMKTRPVYHIHRFDPAWAFTTETRIVEANRPPDSPVDRRDRGSHPRSPSELRVR